MKCEICHREYISSCATCVKRVKAWGTEGTYLIYNLAKEERDIEVSELIEFVNQYYVGKSSHKYQSVGALKLSLKIAGYKGNFIGRVGVDKNDYKKFKYAQTALGYRWRLRREVCDYCDETENLILHHVVPTSWGGVTSDENCITVCDDHHQVIHQKLRKHLNRMRLLEYIKPHQDEIVRLAQQSLEFPYS